MLTLSVGVGRCSSPSVVCPEHNSKMKYPNVLKLDIGNDLGISYKWYGFTFGVKG